MIFGILPELVCAATTSVQLHIPPEGAAQQFPECSCDAYRGAYWLHPKLKPGGFVDGAHGPLLLVGTAVSARCTYDNY